MRAWFARHSFPRRGRPGNLQYLFALAILVSSSLATGHPTAYLGQEAAAAMAPGYALAGADGGVFNFGGGQFHGSLGADPPASPVVAILDLDVFNSYTLVTAGGAVISFGNPCSVGGLSTTSLNAPIVGATTDGAHYWLVGADGGVFSFDTSPCFNSPNDPLFFGSLANIHLKAPIIGIAATPDGGGYWLVDRNGRVYPFGDATFLGDVSSLRLNAPIVGITQEACYGSVGYLLAGADGGVFAFGSACYQGGMAGQRLADPITGISSEGTGYWLVARDGGVFAFGDAPFLGSEGGRSLTAPVVGIAPEPGFQPCTGTGC